MVCERKYITIARMARSYGPVLRARCSATIGSPARKLVVIFTSVFMVVRVL
jgi:hypothetical protein